ncbi:MAG: DUF3999 domain-containing protein [Cyanobacteria bacterium]|nr:DUF3999 domain-containing protein [Cyanobacteriota bacterium]
MMRSIRSSLALLVVSAAGVLAQGPANARFQHERIVDSVGGPQRLDVDAALLNGSQSFAVEDLGTRWVARRGLGDLRLFNETNVEVPYLLIEPAADLQAFGAFRTLPISAIDKPDNKSSGFEVDLLSVRIVDGLLLSTIQPPFLKRFRLEGSGDRERWTQLVNEGTTFNLPAERLQHTLIEFAPGEFRYLRVTFDDTNSARIPRPGDVTIRMPRPRSVGPRLREGYGRQAVLRSDVSISRRPSEPGRSRFRVNLPAARLPIVALEIKAGGGNLLREARVLEAGFAGQGAQPRLIGGGRLMRVERDKVIAESMRLQIRQPTEPQLDLVVDDGDNPPLELQAVTAVFAEMPWIYFEAPAGPITVRYGDSKLTAPRYDLEAARSNLPVSPNRATWRSQPPITLTPLDEGLAMPDTGSAMSSEGFEFVRDIPAGRAGLIALQMDIAAMAHSGRDPRRLRDLRILDRSGMQIPYLLESRDEPLIAEVNIERKALPAGLESPSPKVSTYQVHLPFPDLPKPRLVLTTRARVFQRAVTIGTVVPAADRQPARFVRRGSAVWMHADQDVAPPPLTFDLADSAINEDLYLQIDEGDNQPLQIDKATLLMPQYAVRFFRRDNQPLRLLYGRDDLGPPRYDLQLLSGQVLGRTAEDVTAGPEQALGGSGSAPGFDLVPPMVFWSVLTVTVFVLLGLVVRLMKRESL